MVIALTSHLGQEGWACRASLWLGRLKVLGLKLQGWEEVFFPVKATFGNWAGTSSTSFSKCLACEYLCTALWLDGGGTHKGLYIS